VKGKGKKSLSATPLSDEENIDYSRSGRGGGVQTAYSDEDDGEESAEDGSDWDAESEVDDKAKHTSTGKLGNVETRIRNQSAKKPARLKKPSKLKSPEGIDENQLKKGKIFSADSVGYGNGGNTFQLPPLEEPKPSSFPTLKAGGSGFVSPRPQVQLDTAEMEARIQPYIDLLRQGTPVLLVKTNMARAGETRETIKMMLERADELHLSSDVDLMRLSTEAPGESRVDTDVNKASKEELAVLKQDPDIGKYIKMHGMGIPTANVFQKMELDQVSEENVKRVKRALGVKLEEEDAGTKDNLRESMRRKASVPLLKMHWNTLPPEKLRNSIFANGKDEDSIQDEEMEELEKLFGAQSKVEPEAVAQVVDKRMRLIVLDAKRAQNVVIGLAQFKAFGSHDALLGAVCGMDEMSGHLNGDRLQNLSQLIPSVPESRRIHGMEGSEHPAELFFLVADKYFPDLPKRLACFITCCTFQEACDGVMAKMKKIIDACNEASGFSLDSLLKMVHTKGVDKKTSVLDYVVKSLLDKADDAVMGVSEDLSFDDETARVSGKDTGREADQLLQGVAELEEAHDAAREGRTQSAVADAFTDSFVAKLEAFLAVHRDRLAEMSKMRILMDKKVAIVVEYFGEDQN
ncbi:FMNL1, partial [Symbiodinium microadriaticum]